MALHDLETTIAATSAATSASPIPQAGLGGGECRWVPHASPVGGSGRLLPRFVAISREVSPDTGCSASQFGSSLEYKAEVRGPRSEPPTRAEEYRAAEPPIERETSTSRRPPTPSPRCDHSVPRPRTVRARARGMKRGRRVWESQGKRRWWAGRCFVRACARKEEGAEGVGDKKEKGGMVEGRRTERGRVG